MANRITVSICGDEYTFVAEESTAYMEPSTLIVEVLQVQFLSSRPPLF